MQHIICSLSRKTTIQSTVVKKLSNTERSNKTLAALREYDRVIKCIYVLDYADNKTLRQFVQQALNRGEAYHQLRRAIASVNGNQFSYWHWWSYYGKLSENTSKQNVIIIHTPQLKIQHICQA
ncbi:MULTISPECIES: Tn3 family transposase [Escherichia]|uniref:Tn3 family transposase n=1 Tax=Escherichia coli TaxID=562 RepID=UPI0028E09FEF|nr:Tn3 family transposase [Escherichia coli]